MKIVLQKYIADSGYCSRRKAEELIRDGKVKINKKKAELGMRASDDDDIIIDSKKLELAKKRIYIILNKPAGYTCTNRKFKNEQNIFELINIKERLFTVGRLDKESRGLLILTNDGKLSQKLTHPSFEHEKEYEVEIKVHKFKINNILENFTKGIDIGDTDGIVKAKKIEYLGENKFNIILAEGKKRQIRRMFKGLSLEVNDLKRIRIENIKLNSLKEGTWKFFDNKLI